MAPPHLPSTALFGVLGCPPSADRVRLRAAFARMCKELHPDVSRGDDAALSARRLRFARVVHAWKVLRCEEARARYDATAARADPPPPEDEEADDAVAREACEEAEAWVAAFEARVAPWLWPVRALPDRVSRHANALAVPWYLEQRKEASAAIAHAYAGPPIDAHALNKRGELPQAYEMERATSYGAVSRSRSSAVSRTDGVEEHDSSIVFALVSGRRVLGAVRQPAENRLELVVGAAGVVAAATRHDDGQVVVAERVVEGDVMLPSEWRTAAALQMDLGVPPSSWAATACRWDVHLPQQERTCDCAVAASQAFTTTAASFELTRRRIAGTTQLNVVRSLQSVHAALARPGGLSMASMVAFASGVAVCRRVDVGQWLTRMFKVRSERFDGPTWAVETTSRVPAASPTPLLTEGGPPVRTLSLRALPLLIASIQVAEDAAGSI